MQGTFSRPPREDLFYKVLAGSLIAHVVLLVIGLFFISPGGPRTFFAPVYTVTLVEPAPVKKPAPKKPAPRKTPPRAVKKPPPPPPPKKSVAEKPKPRPAEKTVKIKTEEKAPPVEKKAPPPEKAVDVDSAIADIRERVEEREELDLVARRIERMKETLAAEDRETSRGLEELKKELASLADAGDEAAERARRPAPSGRVTRENLQAKYPEYYRTIHDRVWENWIYPLELGKKDLTIIIAIKIGRGGELLDRRIEVSSGSALFDQSLMNAIAKSAPFPPLPEGFPGDFLDTGLRFCPGCARD